MYKIVTEPVVEPITLSEVKIFLGVDSTDEDSLITQLIKAARTSAEMFMNRKLITTGMELYLDELSSIMLVKYGASSITSVKYYDSDNILQTLASTNYDIDVVSTPARVSLSSSGTFPNTNIRTNAVVIAFDAGYGDVATDIPTDIISGIYLTIKHLYDNREMVVIGSQVNELPYAANYLFNQHRICVF